MRTFHVYIMASRSGVLYTGVTRDLQHRVHQHKVRYVKGFTKRYNVTRLVYFEATANSRAAIAREKEIKGWVRAKKVRLIEASNPDWRDLSEAWVAPRL